MTLIIGFIGAKMLRKHFVRLVNATYLSLDKDARLSAAADKGRQYRVRSDPGWVTPTTCSALIFL